MKTDNAITSFIENFPVPASFKEADTGKFIANNLYNSQQFGIQDPKALTGLTVRELNFRDPIWGARYASAIERLDFCAREKRSHVLERHQFLDHSGDAQMEEMVKFPVMGSRKNILGIVTYRQDITRTLPPFELYRLYRDFYDVPNAISRVLVCLAVDPLFFTQPTDAQFRVFLLKIERFTNKEAAKFLGISDRTVECHLDALRSKVVDHNLAHALSQVKWTSTCAFDSTQC